MKQRIQADIEWLKRKLANIDRDISRATKENPLWQAKDELMWSVSGAR